MCSFGTPYRKNSRLAKLRGDFLSPLARPGAGGHKHVQLTGSLCSKAAEYPVPFCNEYALLARKRYEEEPLQLGDQEAETAADTRGGEYEMMWLNELL
eukprot:9095474-Heterocapsa_arctica.AAC.1